MESGKTIPGSNEFENRSSEIAAAVAVDAGDGRVLPPLHGAPNQWLCPTTTDDTRSGSDQRQTEQRFAATTEAGPLATNLPPGSRERRRRNEPKRERRQISKRRRRRGRSTTRQ